MKIEVKGHSGCDIEVRREESGELCVHKITRDPKYLKRLVLQAEKQKLAAQIEMQHIRVPKIHSIYKSDDFVDVKMDYVYSRNFMEYFENAGFEQIDYLIGGLIKFLEYEIAHSEMVEVDGAVVLNKFNDVCSKSLENPLLKNDLETKNLLSQSAEIFGRLKTMSIPIGVCHGDLTFSNILFNGNNYYLIDFLDSFIESPLLDIVKLRQDTAYNWSQLMYSKRYDAVRLKIIYHKIDSAIDSYFSSNYVWYDKYYSVMQLMNMLRILPYTHDEKVVVFLKNSIREIIKTINTQKTRVDSDALNAENDDKSNKSHLIVPVAADKEEYEDSLPYLFGLDNKGVTICLKSILGLNLEKFDDIWFVILEKHNNKYYIEESLNLQFKRLGIENAHITVLTEPTQDQAETIYSAITKEGIEGRIFIKDADSFFEAEADESFGVAIFPIEELDILTPKDKSYVATDDMFYITNIIEKSLVGRYISAGGYAFKSSDFVKYYEKLRGLGRLYLSNIVFAMLMDKKQFRPIIAENYKDWGTKKDLYRNE